jgi:hypothetical protein
VALPVFGFDSTPSLVGLLDCCEVLDFFCLLCFGFGSAAAGFVSLECVDALVFSAACLPPDADEPEVDESLDVDDDSAPDVPPVSAEATPCPTKTATPIPRAAASPPIRPT